MKLKAFIPLLLLADLALGSNATRKHNLRSGHDDVAVVDRSHDDSLLCHIVLVEEERQQNDDTHQRLHEAFHACTPYESGEDSDLTYAIDLPGTIAEMHSRTIEKGDLFLSIPQGFIHDNAVQLPDGAIVVPPPQGFQSRHMRRRLTSKTGIRTILVVRVNAIDSSPSYSTDELYDLVFAQDGFTLGSQIDACSFGKLKFEPTEHGVVDVQVPLNVGDSRLGLVNAAAIQARELFDGVSHLRLVADHTFFVLPPGTPGGGWLAFANILGWHSYYNDLWIASPSVQIHEIGHAAGMRHAGEAGDEYDDQTGMMGYSSRARNGPMMCFNGANYWYLGWFSDRALEVDLTHQPSLVKIAAFVDYDKTNTQEYVVVKVGDMYLQYNRRKNFNAGTREKANQLTIVQGGGQGGSPTKLLAGLDLNTPIFRKPDSNGSGSSTLVIEVCSMWNSPISGGETVDFMTVSIGIGHSLCETLLTSTPSTIPSQIPSALPSGMPPRGPTLSPTSMPTRRATSGPTRVPTSTPSTVPTFPSTYRPTGPPTTAFPTSDTGQVCDDSPFEEFPVYGTVDGETFINQNQKCIWLAARPEWQVVLCTTAHIAFSVCPETCGRCSDQCEDDKGARFFINGSERDCHWLSLRPAFWETECVPGNEVFQYCRETCNSCGQAEPSGSSPNSGEYFGSDSTDETSTTVPTLTLQLEECDDNPTQSFWVDDVWGFQTCIWLAARPAWQQRLCNQNHPAYTVCPETCGFCSDECHDDPSARFPDWNNHLRNCQWLAIRPHLWGEFCMGGKPARNSCRETCETCTY